MQRVADAKLDLQPAVVWVTPRSRAAQLVGYARRKLSINAVQQTARLLLDQVQLLGDGATEATELFWWRRWLPGRGGPRRFAAGR